MRAISMQGMVKAPVKAGEVVNAEVVIIAPLCTLCIVGFPLVNRLQQHVLATSPVGGLANYYMATTLKTRTFEPFLGGEWWEMDRRQYCPFGAFLGQDN